MNYTLRKSLVAAGNVFLLGVGSLLVLSENATAGATAERLNAAALFSAALNCRADFPDGRDPSLAQRLREVGVAVIDRAPGETLDLLYVFREPLLIDGTSVRSVVVRGGSGSIVAAHATGDLRAFVRRVHARQHPARHWAIDGYGEMPAQFSRSLPVRPGLDELPPRLVVGQSPGAPPGEFSWGCRSYDG